MTTDGSVLVDFIARDDQGSGWRMVLVECGPWSDAAHSELKRIQRRLFGCLDAAFSGQLAATFPDSVGEKLTVRLDCYGVPRDAVEKFFKAFSEGVLRLPPYAEEFRKQAYVREINFEVAFDQIH